MQCPGAIGDPKLLILDVSSGGLAPLVIGRMLDVASRLCRSDLLHRVYLGGH